MARAEQRSLGRESRNGEANAEGDEEITGSFMGGAAEGGPEELNAELKTAQSDSTHIPRFGRRAGSRCVLV